MDVCLFVFNVPPKAKVMGAGTTASSLIRQTGGVGNRPLVYKASGLPTSHWLLRMEVDGQMLLFKQGSQKATAIISSFLNSFKSKTCSSDYATLFILQKQACV